MRRLLLLGTLVLVSLTVAWAGADDPVPAARSEFDVERFYRDVRLLVRRHYPDASAHRLGNKIHFEHDTRVFIVHEPLKTGEWQDPQEERGPRKGGVYCDIEYRPGRYGGQVPLPRTVDKRYFELVVSAPHSEKLHAYLYVHLKLPAHGRSPEGFQEELKALLAGFDAYTTPE